MVDIRPLLALHEFDKAVALQKTHWGDDAEAVIPAHMLFSIARHGGHVLAALDGERLAGVLVGFLGTDIEQSGPVRDALCVISKRMLVLPDYRNHGLAMRLKLSQRTLAIQQGIRASDLDLRSPDGPQRSLESAQVRGDLHALSPELLRD